MQKSAATSEEESGKERLSLLYPSDLSVLNRHTLSFSWQLHEEAIQEEELTYVVRIYDMVPKSQTGQNKEPVFTKEVRGSSVIGVSKEELRLSVGRVYLWEAAAYNENGELVARSSVSRFTYRTQLWSTFEAETSLRRTVLPNLMPHAPHLWGCPVSVRWRSQAEPGTSIPEEESGPPGEVETQSLIWAASAATVYLIPQTWASCSLRWDYSRYENCDSVVLQMAGATGFAHGSGSPDVLDDPNVVVALAGPLTTDCAGASMSDDLARLDSAVETYSSQNFNLRNPDFWEHLPTAASLRLVALDSHGVPDMASDPATAFLYDDWPGIAVENVTVNWTWGDTPRREILYSIETTDEFGVGWSSMPECPFTLVTGSWSSDLTDVEMTINGVTPPDRTMVESDIVPDYPAYVLETNSWVPGNTYECRLVQEWPSYDGYTIRDLEEFAEAKIMARCFPGISADWAYCHGPMSAAQCRLPDLAPAPVCGPCLSIGQIISGWLQLFEFFDSTFTGSRSVVSFEERRFPPEYHAGMSPEELDAYMEVFLDDDNWRVDAEETGRTEEAVTIRFGFPDNPTNGTQFHASLLRPEMATMTETIGGSSRMYDFNWWGNHAELVERFGENRPYHGDTRHEMGTIWLGEHLDSMAMSFQFRSPGELVPEGGGEQRHMMYTYDVIGYTLDN